MKSAFLNGPLEEEEEEVYVNQPSGWEPKKRKDSVFKLYKILYGLK